MTFQTGTGFVPRPKDKGGRPERNVAKRALVVEAARNSEHGAHVAAIGIHSEYYRDLARCEGDQYHSQLKYLAKLIRSHRNGLMPID